MMWGTGIERYGDHYSSAASFMQPHTDWMAIGMFLIPLMLLGVIIWLVLRSTGTLPARAALTAPVAPPTVAPHAADGAEKIVRERFARGEIDSDEYARLITALRS
jgi:uncharacterized membrane protein